MDYLARKEVDLHPPRSELTFHEEQCIVFVAGHRHKIRDEMRDSGAQDYESREFRTDADPEEMEVSDSDLLNLAAKKRGR